MIIHTEKGDACLLRSGIEGLKLGIDHPSRST